MTLLIDFINGIGIGCNRYEYDNIMIGSCYDFWNIITHDIAYSSFLGCELLGYHAFLMAMRMILTVNELKLNLNANICVDNYLRNVYQCIEQAFD